MILTAVVPPMTVAERPAAGKQQRNRGRRLIFARL
jgi:hypothetical protein